MSFIPRDVLPVSDTCGQYWYVAIVSYRSVGAMLSSGVYAQNCKKQERTPVTAVCHKVRNTLEGQYTEVGPSVSQDTPHGNTI